MGYAIKLRDIFRIYMQTSWSTWDIWQTKLIHLYTNAKGKLIKINATIWFNKMCRLNHLGPKYRRITFNGNTAQVNSINWCVMTMFCCRKWSITSSGFYHTVFFLLLLCINCILVVRHPDDDQEGDRNMLVKNNMWLSVFKNVHLLVYHVSKLREVFSTHRW